MIQILPSFVRSVSAAAVVLALVAAPAAQRLIGGAHSPATGPILATQNVCAPSARLCGPLLAPPPLPAAGGTAYDPRRQVVWNTDGPTLAGVQRLASAPCSAFYCPPAPAPLPAGALATGLAFDESRDAVWMIDNSPSLSLLRLSATARCPALAARCSLAAVIPPTHTPGSLAFSERLQMVFWSSSVFGGGAAANIVYVARANDPCTVICRITLFGTVGCGGGVLGPITGMAFDDCTDRIYVTDGVRVLSGVFLQPCGATSFACCAAALVAPYYGLDIEAEHPVRVGASCLQAACGACPSLSLSAVGDPSLGNPAFALRISGAPTGGLSAIALSAGPCGAGLPLWCGLLHPAFPPGFVFPLPLAGGGACGGTATQPLPIPMMPWTCGLKLCAQGAILCVPAGNGLTNALELTLSDS
jgi:hypothetical protein